ncbi:SDR family oxidoreductase [Sphingorhabdus sp. Alg239-R122]|uniref:SDR family oxidoreductase n=1 Tax=Sphingorhabdus sp. Alg239-R122 TaxID=2305989 RepID=UPI0013DC72C5|nr:SDR family oxidoreductase [Sphingorhabdus sp. Alg239-R122]
MSARLALVTGGCRRVGAAIAARLARDGWSLALHGHSDAEPEDALAETLAAQDTNWHGFVADLAVPDTCADLISDVTAYFRRAPDLLVNNASLFTYDDADSLTAENMAAHFAVNMQAPVLLTQKLVALSQSDSVPCIVNIVDQRVRNPNGDQLSYTLSKQALAESIRTLAVSYGARARINGVAPGLTLPTDEYDGAQMAALAGKMPLERLPVPDDIADAVLYLAEAKAVTGEIIFVDGGAHLTHFARDFVFLGK